VETKTVGGRKFLMLSWAEIEKLVESIEEALGRDGYRPDTLVGILRGGMIVADLLFLALDEFEKTGTVEIYRIDLIETMLYLKALDRTLRVY
jgi:hypoxanthine phosphoribosyltransferase